MKTAVIGVGRMGRRHLHVVKQLGLDLVAIADQNAEALALAETECGAASSLHFRDATEALRTTRPECVIIATTAPTHAEYARTAAEAGTKFILCEKPMAVSLAACNEMIAVCRANGTRLAINHQMRFMEQYTEPKALLESELLGGLTSVSVITGNFGLAMNGTHYIEMFRFMTGESAEIVNAWFSAEAVPNPRGAQFEDRAGCVRAVTASGTRFYLDSSADQGHGLTVVYGARYGQIYVDELAGLMRVTARDAEHRALPTTRYGMPWGDQTTQIAPADVLAPTRAVVSALLAGENYPTGEDGRQAVAALVAAYVSAESDGRRVCVDDNLPSDRTFPWA